MALLGQAALAMWWDMAPDMRADFEHWHTHEHFPERLAIPGFLRASRWAAADGGEGFFILYELREHAVLSSPAYLARLNAPTPWSTRLMPHHRNMVRSQTRVLASAGAAIGACAITVRLSPAPGREEELLGHLGRLVQTLAGQPGLAGAHLLRTETPAITQTTEQKIRGGADRAADWILVVCGYDGAQLDAAQEPWGSAEYLRQSGVAAGVVVGRYRLSLSAVAGELGPG